jgi:hypothetical protein
LRAANSTAASAGASSAAPTPIPAPIDSTSPAKALIRGVYLIVQSLSPIHLHRNSYLRSRALELPPNERVVGTRPH